ncbi:MAG: c-type cytochrome [Hyphomicrobiaceae bacterium]
MTLNTRSASRVFRFGSLDLHQGRAWPIDLTYNFSFPAPAALHYPRHYNIHSASHREEGRGSIMMSMLIRRDKRNRLFLANLLLVMTWGLAWGLASGLVLVPNLLSAQGNPPDSKKSKQQSSDWHGQVDYWQPKWMQRELWGPGQMPTGMRVRVLRHWTYVNYGVPDSYNGASSTIQATGENILAGAKLYQNHCQRCHGPHGLGNGTDSLSLLPSPALLAYMIKRPISADEYLLWAISDGGAQFQTSMPSFKDKLSRTDIWRIIAFMRNGFTKKATSSRAAKDNSN